MNPPNPSQIPEQGQLVEVRQRMVAVIDVAKGTLAGSVLDKNHGRTHHLITLSSIEDDALGQELQVIWELEPQTRIHEQAALPEPSGFDEPHRLDAFLNAVRWGASGDALVPEYFRQAAAAGPLFKAVDAGDDVQE